MVLFRGLTINQGRFFFVFFLFLKKTWQFLYTPSNKFAWGIIIEINLGFGNKMAISGVAKFLTGILMSLVVKISMSIIKLFTVNDLLAIKVVKY